MKFIKLEFKNLASFAGEHVVDFRNPALQSCSIFSICGPTGSGKSTILDAITLALFGTTYRLNNSEVYSTIGEKDKSPKDQSRKDQSRKDQSQKDQSRIKANDPRNILTKGEREAYSKLTFIGQDGKPYRAEWQTCFKTSNYGDATCALYAFKDEKWTKQEEADLKWTPQKNTYKANWKAKFGRAVGVDFDQFSNSVIIPQNKFDIFLSESEADRSKLLEKMIGTGDKFTGFMNAVAELKKKASERLQALKGQLAENERDLLTNEQVEEFKSHIAELQSDIERYTGLVETLTAQAEWYKTDAEMAKQNSKNRGAYNNAKTRMNALADWRKRLARYDALQDAIRLSRELASLQADIATVSAQIDKLAAGVPAQEAGIARLNEASAAKHANLQAAEANLAAAGPEIAQARELKARRQPLSDAQNQAQTARDAALTARDVAERAIHDNEAAIHDAETRIGEQEAAMAQLTENQNNRRAGLQRPIDETAALLDARQAQIAGIDPDELNRNRAQTDIDLADLDKISAALRYKHLTDENATIAEQIEDLDLDSLDHQAQAMAEELAVKRTEGIDAIRNSLHRGDRCPVCGALIEEETIHNVIREIDELENKLNALRRDIEQRRASERELMARREANSRELRTLSELYPELATDFATFINELLTAHVGWTVDGVDDLRAQTSERCAGIQSELERFAAVNREIASLSQQLNDARQALETYNETARNEQTLANQALGELRERMAAFRGQTVTLQTNLANREQAVAQAENQYREARQNLETLEAELRAMLNGEDPDTVADRLTRAVDAARQASDKAAQALTQAQHQLELTQTTINERQNTLDARQTRSAQAQAELDRNISAYNAVHNEPVQQVDVEALTEVPQEQWQQTRTDITTADNAAIAAHTTYRNGVLQRLKHRHDRPLAAEAEVNKQLEENKQQLEESTRNQQEKQSKLNRHNQQSAHRVELEAQLREVKSECENWKTLIDKLGSDGGNLRKMEQCFTLRFIVEQANREIERFSCHRYVLRQVPNSLGLDVEDDGKTRSASTLSGGEKFIVSLGLALALASLSANNFHSSHLFIDEGFGTLDSNTLETIIAVLGQLNDTQGRKVGLISHSDIIHENVETRIEIKKKPDNHSCITMP